MFCGVTTSVATNDTVAPLLIAPGIVWLGRICTASVLLEESSATKAMSCVADSVVKLNDPVSPGTRAYPDRPRTSILAVRGKADASTDPVAVPFADAAAAQFTWYVVPSCTVASTMFS